MGWNEENEGAKKGSDLASKILIAIIFCITLIIILISILLMNVETKTTFAISVDGKDITTTQGSLLTKIDGTTYINIQEFSKLAGYEFHEGEYKAFTIEKDKCYVQGKNETATFYLDDNKVCKLPVNAITEDYIEYTIENPIKNYNEKMYAPIEAIKIAFNVVLEESEQYFKIYTLDYLVSLYDTNAKKWGYTGISNQSFENQKALLYGYLIVKKESGLYKIIDNNNTKEIVSDKYNSIEFAENTKEFFVTNSLGQVGIINLDGTTKIEPVYDSIAVLDKKENLYLIRKDKKYGVVKSGNITVIFPEYDSIGLDKNWGDNKYLILDTLIPVYKNSKWGAFDKTGKLIYKIEYDGFGCNLTTAEIDGVKKVVNPLLSIDRCNGIVVKKLDKYGLLDTNGKELVPIAVTNIYEVQEAENEKSRYFMLYNGEELNVLERLIDAGLIKYEDEEIKSNTIQNNTVNNKGNNTVNMVR